MKLRSFPNPAGLVLTTVLSLLLFITPTGRLSAAGYRTPEPDPPKVDRNVPEAPSPAAVSGPLAPSPAGGMEWTYHKTADNRHPDGNEQQLMWLMNRARSNPAQEGIWLSEVDDADIAAARTYWNVDIAVLKSQFAAIAAKPPAAFDVRLYNAARAHSDYLISIDGQNHTGQFDRIDAAGFEYTTARGNVYSYSESAIYGHAAFNIDWGSGAYGMQVPPGHRYAIMSIDGNYTNVGIAGVPETNPATQVGPQVITGNFCYANAAYPNHYNRFIVGTVWEDTNGNSQYDPGEGLAGVRVDPDKGSFFAVTADGGGYAVPILAPDTYTVTFSGGELVGTYTQSASVSSASVLLDLEYYDASATTPPTGGGTTGGGGAASGGGGGGGGGGCLIGAAADGLGWNRQPWPGWAAAVLALALALPRAAGYARRLKIAWRRADISSSAGRIAPR